MNSRKDKQNNKKTNDPKDDTGVAVQIHTAFARKHVGSYEKGDAERWVYHHQNGGKDKTYSEGC